MELSIQIINPTWKPVYVIEAGTTHEQLQKDTYRSIRSDAGKIINHFLCYSWGTNTEVKYCGSIARDYQRGGFKSNLEGRVHNYFKNHRQEENGRKNSNLNVFENICTTLKGSDVILSILVFENILLGKKTITYEKYSENPELIQAVEQILICSYKDLGQTPWNRTPSSRMRSNGINWLERDNFVYEPCSQIVNMLNGGTMWLDNLISLKGRIISTLGNDKKFEIVEVDEKAVYVLPDSTDNLRRIPMKEFEKAWKHMVTHKQLSLIQIIEMGSRNSAYIATIISKFPGVTFRKKPVILILK